MRSTGSPQVSPVTCVDDEGNGPLEVMCHMWMPEHPPPWDWDSAQAITVADINEDQWRRLRFHGISMDFSGFHMITYWWIVRRVSPSKPVIEKRNAQRANEVRATGRRSPVADRQSPVSDKRWGSPIVAHCSLLVCSYVKFRYAYLTLPHLDDVPCLTVSDLHCIAELVR